MKCIFIVVGNTNVRNLTNSLFRKETYLDPEPVGHFGLVLRLTSSHQ